MARRWARRALARHLVQLSTYPRSYSLLSLPQGQAPRRELKLASSGMTVTASPAESRDRFGGRSRLWRASRAPRQDSAAHARYISSSARGLCSTGPGAGGRASTTEAPVPYPGSARQPGARRLPDTERCADARSGWSALSVGPRSIACTSSQGSRPCGVPPPGVMGHLGAALCTSPRAPPAPPLPASVVRRLRRGPSLDRRSEATVRFRLEGQLWVR